MLPVHAVTLLARVKGNLERRSKEWSLKTKSRGIDADFVKVFH